MNAQDLRLDYFKIYDVVEDRTVDYSVALQGQFDKERKIAARLLFLGCFANPVSKNGEPFYNPNAHLTWYQLYQPKLRWHPTRRVLVENQFGKQEIRIGGPLDLFRGRQPALLAPAQKGDEGRFPARLDHFKLYFVVEGKPLDNEIVTLQDQFGSEEVTVTDLVAFGTPVKKEYKGKVSPIHNEEAHLMIYRITPQSPPSVESVAVLDQFDRHHLDLGDSLGLAVPSVKLKWEEL